MKEDCKTCNICENDIPKDSPCQVAGHPDTVYLGEHARMSHYHLKTHKRLITEGEG